MTAIPQPSSLSTRERTSTRTLLLLVAMTGIGPISLYMLVPVLPVLATTFGRDISVVQMTVSLFMLGLAISQLVTGPLSDRFGRKPVLIAGLGLMVIADVGCIFAQTLPQLIAARFLQALGGATGMVISRAIVRDLYPRERVGGMISIVIAVMMIAQMLSPLIGGLIDTHFGWHGIFYLLTLATILVLVSIAVMLPETRRVATSPAGQAGSGFARDLRSLLGSRAYLGYAGCMVLASSLIFTFAGGGPYIVVQQMGRSTAEYGAWFATSGFGYLLGNIISARYSPRLGLDKMIWTGLALQLTGAGLNLVWSLLGFNSVPSVLFGTHVIAMIGNALIMANASAAAISVRPEAAGMASGIMGFLQMGYGALCSQVGAWLGAHSATPLPLTAGLVVTALACAATMVFIVPRLGAPGPITPADENPP